MSYVEMTEISGGIRGLTDTELSMVAGGGTWWDLLKVAGGTIGGLLGGPGGAALGASSVILTQAIVNSYDSSVPPGTGVNTSIADAAL